QEALVRAGPEHAFLNRRFGQGKDHVVIFYAGDVVLDRTAARLLFALIIAGEIATDLRPSLAVVSRSEDRLACGINRVGIMRRKNERRNPLKAVNLIFCAMSGLIYRPK